MGWGNRGRWLVGRAECFKFGECSAAAVAHAFTHASADTDIHPLRKGGGNVLDVYAGRYHFHSRSTNQRIVWCFECPTGRRRVVSQSGDSQRSPVGDL